MSKYTDYRVLVANANLLCNKYDTIAQGLQRYDAKSVKLARDMSGQLKTMVDDINQYGIEHEVDVFMLRTMVEVRYDATIHAQKEPLNECVYLGNGVATKGTICRLIGEEFADIVRIITQLKNGDNVDGEACENFAFGAVCQIQAYMDAMGLLDIDPTPSIDSRFQSGIEALYHQVETLVEKRRAK